MTDYKLVPTGATAKMLEAGEYAKYTDCYVSGIYADMLAEAPIINIVATKNKQGQIVSVTLQDEDHRILEVIAETAVQGEPVATIHVDGSFVHVAWRIPAPSRCAMDVYTAPQTAEQQQPSLQSPPDDPLGGLEHRADGESNFYTLSRPTGNWVARIQFNGELHTHEQERILNAMLSDRNVRYGDGYHQGYWDARQKSPDVAGLERALKSMVSGYMRLLQSGYDRITDLGGDCDPVDVMERGDAYLREARATLAAHRKQGGV